MEVLEVDESLEKFHGRSSKIVNFYEYLHDSKANFEKSYGNPSRSKYSIQNFDILRTIGMGSFSKVVLARDRESGTFHAIKVMGKESIVVLSATRYVMRERHILRSISFPFIISVQTTFQDNSFLYIVMPFLNGGDLFNQLKVQDHFSEKTAAFYVAQIVLCFEYLHYLGLVYRDLKPENVLLDSLGYVKLTDLGFSKRLVGRTYTFCGTPEYMAPEIVLGKGYGRGVDWWALGVISYELVAGRVPFQASEPAQLYERIAMGEFALPNEFSPPLRSFISGLLEKEASRRLGCLKKGTEEVKMHPWLSGIDWVGLLDKSVVPPFIPNVKGPDDSSHYDFYEDLVIKEVFEDKYSRLFTDF